VVVLKSDGDKLFPYEPPMIPLSLSVLNYPAVSTRSLGDHRVCRISMRLAAINMPLAGHFNPAPPGKFKCHRIKVSGLGLEINVRLYYQLTVKSFYHCWWF
jgi:hypothetical protein